MRFGMFFLHHQSRLSPTEHRDRTTKKAVCTNACLLELPLMLSCVASFKFISVLSFPTPDRQFKAAKLTVYQSDGHDPLVLFAYPDSDTVSILNLSHLRPCRPPPCPWVIDDVAELAKRMRLDQGDEAYFFKGSDGPPLVTGWRLHPPAHSEHEKVRSCAMTQNGAYIISIGSKGSIWLWTRGS